ncbi:MAG: ATP-dependent DNA ligase, partial [Actinomycetota bacterium]
PRARDEATVSFPVTPDELASVSPDDFTIASVPELLDRPGPKRWSALVSERGRLPKTLLHD